MHALIDHLRDLASDRLGTGKESPLDPGIAHRATALLALADLLEEEPSLVRPEVRRTLDLHVLEPLPEIPMPVLGLRAAAVLVRYGWDGPVAVSDHLRVLDRLAAAVVRDAWEQAAAGAILLENGTTVQELADLLGLHAFEVEAAAAGLAPDPEYLARRAGLTEDERRAQFATTSPSSPPPTR